jgi:hypothetical protein
MKKAKIREKKKNNDKENSSVYVCGANQRRSTKKREKRERSYEKTERQRDKAEEERERA